MLRTRPLIGSLVVHLGLLLLVFGMTRFASTSRPVTAVPAPHASRVWLTSPDLGGGRGGGGDHTLLARKAALQPTPPPSLRPAEREPTPQPTLEAVAPVADMPALAGTIEQASTTAPTQGPGDGGGADAGKGPGVGPAAGPGIGNGPGGTSIGDGYRVGNGVSAPRLVRAVKPQYTPDAMRARISGSVWLDCVVDARGQVDRCRLSRSLDPNFGLDQEAVKAARQWTFEPGIKAGEPVSVQVTIELAFSLR